MILLLTGLWAAVALIAEPLASMIGIARYRLVENGDYEPAERLEQLILHVASLARALRTPGAMRLEALALADRAETDRNEGELSQAESFYVRSIQAYRDAGMDDDPRLVAVLTNYASLLSRLGRTQGAERADERARYIGQRSIAPLQTK